MKSGRISPPGLTIVAPCCRRLGETPTSCGSAGCPGLEIVRAGTHAAAGAGGDAARRQQRLAGRAMHQEYRHVLADLAADQAAVELELIVAGDTHAEHRGFAIDRHPPGTDPGFGFASRAEPELR